MTKVAILGDVHIGARNDSDVISSFQEKFFSEVFFPTLKERGITNIIQVGDLFDRRKYIEFNSLHKAKKYLFDQISINNMHMHVIVGNHDTRYKNSNHVNSPDLLLEGYSEEIFVYADPTHIYYGAFGAEPSDKKIAMLPWICPENEQKSMEMIQESDADILFGHLELDGFEMYRGAPHAGGLSASLFSKFQLVCSGHFHHRSKVGNINYVGTPYETTWSDYGDPKGFHILDLETLDMEFIENPNRLFHKIKYDDSKWSNASWIDGFDFTDLKDSYVKVIVINKSNPYWFDLYMDKLEKMNPAQVQVVEDNLNLDLVDDDDILENIDDTLTILHKSIETMATDVDKNLLDNLFKSLYTEALDMD